MNSRCFAVFSNKIILLLQYLWLVQIERKNLPRSAPQVIFSSPREWYPPRAGLLSYKAIKADITESAVRVTTLRSFHFCPIYLNDQPLGSVALKNLYVIYRRGSTGPFPLLFSHRILRKSPPLIADLVTSVLHRMQAASRRAQRIVASKRWLNHAICPATLDLITQ